MAGKVSKKIIYRDGRGKVLPDTDIELRNKANRDLEAIFSRKIEYEGNIRSGKVIYIEGEKRIEFPNEMALGRREDILKFLAATVQSQQATNCNYIIKEKEIGFYFK